MIPERVRAEVAIVGSGAGGAPLAARLAEAGWDVVILDSGPALAGPDFDGDEARLLPRLMNAALARDSGMDFYAGSCVGGSTVVNDALCWRTPPEVLAEWRESGLSGFSEAAFGGFVDEVWRDIHATATGRTHLNRNAQLMERGAQRLGWSSGAMHRNVRGCVNLGLCNLGCPSRAKQSMLRTYLPRARHAGARLLPSTRAEKIEISNGKVQALLATRIDPDSGVAIGRVRVEADAIVLAAGVLGTSSLLAASGARAAGRDFQVHSSAYVSARFEEPVYAFYGPTMAYAVSEFSDVNGHGGPGYMIESVTANAAVTAQSLPGFGAASARAMEKLPHLARAVVVLRDRTRGSISGCPGEPEIAYPIERGDVDRMRDGLLASARLFFAAGAREVWLPLLGSDPLESPDELEAYAQRRLRARDFSLLYAVHLFGGACMGARADDRSVTREDGRLWDVEGLYVSDASTLPSNTGVNPQVTVMANALRIASELVG